MIDAIIGEPRGIPHPVVLIGRLILRLERMLYSEGAKSIQQKLRGALLVIIVVAVSTVVTWGIIWAAMLAHRTAGFIVSIVLLSTTIATKALVGSAKDVAEALSNGDINEAKTRVGRIVGRDTAAMKKRDIIRATIESVAENAVDGVIAPILFALIGGAPLAMAYKAINTMDSMIGYKNERYGDFGWAAAKLDDLVNYIPARISVAIIGLSALLYGRDATGAFRIARRDARRHASPNSGFPEAAIAGVFRLKLGGTNYYAGVPRKTGFIGDGKGALSEKIIDEVNHLVFISSALTILLGRAFIYVVDFIPR
jgi:adenosylcobinamide-phosphate synthase